MIFYYLNLKYKKINLKKKKKKEKNIVKENTKIKNAFLTENDIKRN